MFQHHLIFPTEPVINISISVKSQMNLPLRGCSNICAPSMNEQSLCQQVRNDAFDLSSRTFDGSMSSSHQVISWSGNDKSSIHLSDPRLHGLSALDRMKKTSDGSCFSWCWARGTRGCQVIYNGQLSSMCIRSIWEFGQHSCQSKSQIRPHYRRSCSSRTSKSCGQCMAKRGMQLFKIRQQSHTSSVAKSLH